MGMFYTAYFDASGQREGFAILTVAGAVSNITRRDERIVTSVAGSS